MRKLVDLRILHRMDNLIRRSATGTPEDFARRLGIARSSMFAMVDFLRDELKAPIIYSRFRDSYIYEYPPQFYLGFERERLNHGEMTGTCGGDGATESGFEQETLPPAGMAGICGGGEKKKKKKKKNKITVEIEIDGDACILDDDIDFNELYL